MRKLWILILSYSFILHFDSYGQQGVFYREYWASFDQNISNTSDKRWRVNDADLSLHKNFGKMPESHANGLLLIKMNEDLFEIEQAGLYLELWGGHEKTENKRFYLNGRGPYNIPESGTIEGNDTYSYPEIPLKVSNLVSGANAFQFACDRGESFWGHFIIDNACLKCYLKADHPALMEKGLQGFSADPAVEGSSALGDKVKLYLKYDKKYEKNIQSVDFYGKYLGYDDNGDRKEDDWHGFTLNRKPMAHLGTSGQPPFTIIWDTHMIPDQGKPMAIQAIVHLNDSIFYQTPDLNGLSISDRKERVMMYYCTELPAPFHSRISKESVAKLWLPADLSDLEEAQLLIKTWDGGAGTIKEPFTLNGHPYNVISGKSIHNVVFTVTEVDPKHLRSGENTFRLISDTGHHGIEVLLPGPCLILRYKN